MNRFLSCAILCAMVFTACKKDDVKPADIINKNKIAEITDNHVIITLWSDNKVLQTGYNRLYVSLKDEQGNEIKNATVTYAPVMDMTSMKHGCPAEQPLYNSELKLYEGAVVFTMATSEMGVWKLGVSANGVAVSFPLTINEASQKRSGVYVGTDENKYVLALVPPVKWQIGLNDLDILISRQEAKMDFSAAEGLTVEFTPEMSSMGHGSPNNVNPVSAGNGHYKGKVNYTMTGDWRLHFRLKKDNVVIVEDAYVDVLF